MWHLTKNINGEAGCGCKWNINSEVKAKYPKILGM